MPIEIKTTGAHFELKNDISDVLRKYEHLSAIEILAVASQIVGMIIANQDARTISPAYAMKVVELNIELGNQIAVQPLSNPAGRA